MSNAKPPYKESRFHFGVAGLITLLTAIIAIVYTLTIDDNIYNVYVSLILFVATPFIAYFGITRQKNTLLASVVFGVGILPAAISLLLIWSAVD